MESNNTEQVKNLIDDRKKIKIIKDAFNEIKPTKKSIVQYCISIISGIVIGFAISFFSNTVDLMRNTVQDANNILLTLIAMIFGSYSIFQALMSRDLVALLIRTSGDLLKESNKTFVQLIILYVIGIISNFILIIFLRILPDDYLLLENIIACNIIAGIGIMIYIFYHMLLFLEVINFAINLYRMFCVYNTLKALDVLEDD